MHRHLYSLDEMSRARHLCLQRGALVTARCPACCPYTYAYWFARHRKDRP